MITNVTLVKVDKNNQPWVLLGDGSVSTLVNGVWKAYTSNICIRDFTTGSNNYDGDVMWVITCTPAAPYGYAVAYTTNGKVWTTAGGSGGIHIAG